MLAKPLHISLPQIIISSTLITGILACIFASEVSALQWVEDYAIHILFSYIGLGLCCLVLNQSRLMFTSFLCASALCLYLKDASSTDIIYPTATGGIAVSIAQINISASNEDDPYRAIKAIRSTEADIISIQEITPDWGMLLEEELSAAYPYHSSVYRPEDFLGISIYSKHPFENLDTFYYNDIPNLAMTIKGAEEDDEIHFINSYIYPNLLNAPSQMEGHFDVISAYLRKLEGPVITFGEYNQLQWSASIKEFRQEHFLSDSRRFPFFDYPTNHIFYSRHFNCTDFKSVSAPTTQHLGVIGNFELKQDFLYAQKASRKF